MPRPFTILFEDDRLLAVLKPPRMLTVAAPDGQAEEKGAPLVDRLRAEGRAVLAVHRIDFETSGVVLFAKDAGMRESLMQMFKERRIEKTYLLLVEGHPHPPAGRIDFPIKDLGAGAAIAKDGSPAVTHYETIRRVGPATLLRARPETGRHNQIRLHFARLGHPLVGERKFAFGRDSALRHKRVLLHAETLTFRAPHMAEDITISAPLTEDFENAVAKIAALPASAARTSRDAAGPRGLPRGRPDPRPALRRRRGRR